MRTFGTQISGNARIINGKRRELTSEERAAIITGRQAGVPRNVLATDFHCSPSTINRTLARFYNHQSLSSLPRSGRPEKLTQAEKRYIRCMVKRHSRMTWKALILDSPQKVCKNTLRRILGKHFRRKWRAVKRIQLTKAHAKERLKHARYFMTRKVELLEGMYSDESTIQTTPNSLDCWLFRLPEHKYDKENVNIQEHVKAEISMMVWGMIWKGGRSELVIMERDEAAARNGYSANSYTWALEEGLLPYYIPGRFFLQDNAKIHVAKHVKAWFEEHGIWVQEHPAHSPDLNPIEHVWKAMKAILRKDYPDLHLLKDNKENRQKVAEAIKVAWQAVPQELIDRLINSMPKRLKV
ncbi:hypothetical protein BP6252_04354 [Coleophoma cylindrospora]|uniref:Tc1-like transposase DDE domain-containing protein n=1 Tax=Coleophoma cylindrospora TaxID=1849047 RepID=A0A3D8S0A7_9HELO|nr:hypothetical protein BP6252_04354 [Coleophoma cylindrospora]